MNDQEAFAEFARLVDSDENQALPEAERLPMIAGWERKDCGMWERPVYIHTDDLEYKHWYSVYSEHPDPIDLQAASGVLAGWLVKNYKLARNWGRGYTWLDEGESHEYRVEYSRTMATFDDYPTLLAAQVAAVRAVLGVKQC